MSSVSRSYSISHRSGKPSIARSAPARDFTAVPTAMDVKYFVPCAATASRFLYVQGTSIVCCHHDKLTIEHTFFRHSDEVQLLAVDNSSDHGAGRLAVSYDAGQTAIVWDLMTGDEMSRFASYEHLTTAAWMRNGNVAFGNTQGNIILFEPTTSEHISSRTIDQIAITALAPSSDCRTFAIGYSNGSLLVATLQPRFTILHNLTTSKAPSPIVTLAWHASSTRSKTDMLAVQTHDGDLRVWSVSKSYKPDDPAKVVRILRRNENCFTGPNWMGWSKNGRVIQFSDSETLSWDVRTKHVTHDSIPTLTDVKGIAVYGPGASLFTLGPNNTVQQFDLNSPAIMVANVQHPAGLLPPSPPTSEELARSHSATTIHTSESESSSAQKGIISESDDDDPSPFAHLMRQPAPAAGYVPYKSVQSMSSLSGASSASKSSTGSQTPGQQARSLRSRGFTEVTHISAGSGLNSSTLGKRTENHWVGSSLPSIPSSASSRSRHQPSSLRNEVPRSPDDENTVLQELFKYTRSRLTDIPYKHSMAPSDSRLTNDDLRKQMLGTIFGWHGEVEDLIRDEMSRHSPGSASRILLAKWLGDVDSDMMVSGLRHMTISDWMLLALSGIGQQSQQNLLRAYVQRLLENQDLHIAVTIMIGMGEFNDGIEVYVSHKRYMEALILTGLVFPGVWERQAAIIRKWGEWAVQHGQQQLAIRCFACTGQESSEPWTSPSATQLNFRGISASIPEILSPPRSPFVARQGPKRSIAKSSALKVITSFGSQNDKSKFYSQLDGGQTPIAAGVTPILDSALSPHGGVELTATALHHPSNSSRFNTPTSALPSGPNFSRGRLSSIGEAPSDLNRNKPVEQTTRPRNGSLTSASSTNRKLKTDYGQRERNGSIQSLEAAQYHSKKDSKRPGSTDRVRGSLTHRQQSSERRGYSRDPSEERGRTSARMWEKSKRSPTSPIPMSPKDLAVLGRHNLFGPATEPLAMRKARSVKGGRTSRTSSRGSRRSSDGRARPSASDNRGRSKARAYSASRSPSPPAALSAAVMYHQDSEDEQDYQKAIQAHEEFRAKHSQSTNRGLTSPTASRHEFSEIHRKEMSESGDVFATSRILRAASTERVGDLRQMKDEKQKKKEKAARELEERRRSLAKRQHITTIPHPSEIALTKLPVAIEADEERFPEGIPPRCATEPPGRTHRQSEQHRAEYPEKSSTMRSHLSLGDHFHLGLGDQAKDAPSIPVAPAQEKNTSNVNPKGKKEQPPPLTLLPSTVYQPPSQPMMIARSMSAPIPDEVLGSNHHHHQQHHHRDTGSTGETRALGHILEDRIDEEEQTPMTPLPPRLKELQHLAIPPPPPPPPLPHMPRSFNGGGGAFGSGMIEIVVDEDDAEKSAIVAPNDGMVPVLPLPVVPVRGHERRRSNGDGSISGRSFKMTDLVHSVSRSRKNSVKTQHAEVPIDLTALNQLRSPTSGAPPHVAMYDPSAFRSPFEPHRRNNSTGFHENGMF